MHLSSENVTYCNAGIIVPEKINFKLPWLSIRVPKKLALASTGADVYKVGHTSFVYININA